MRAVILVYTDYQSAGQMTFSGQSILKLKLRKMLATSWNSWNRAECFCAHLGEVHYPLMRK